MSFVAGSATASLIFFVLWPLAMTIAAWVFATRWVHRRFGKRWAIPLGLTVIPAISYLVMFNLTFLVGRAAISLGLG